MAEIPEHLRLAGQWADAALHKAADAQVHEIQARAEAVSRTTADAQWQVAAIEAQHSVAADILRVEMAAVREQVGGLAQQSDRLAQLMDALDRNVSEMEDAMRLAEGAVGMTLGNRVEQLAHFLKRSALQYAGASAAQPAGVPYLRQWAPRDQAIPRVIDHTQYI
ncbi:hypothetical protein H4R19_001279 [Coemansia spiralis]|nr:hypothetical protein H4R19_001279 [Coemansia spiralis]